MRLSYLRDYPPFQKLICGLLGEAGWEPRPVIFDEFRVDGATGEFRGRIEVVDARRCGRWGTFSEVNSMIGNTLCHYEILEPLGSGGIGEVCRAHDTNLKRDLATKMLPEDFTSDSERLARFEREAHLLASPNHAGIAAIGMSCCDVLVLILEAVMPDNRKGF